MLLFRKIVLNTCPSKISDYYSEKMDYCVSIHIDFLAIDSCFQHKGIGTSVLKTIIATCKRLIPFIPVRLITLDALKEYYEWYCKNGFVAFDEKDLTNDCPTIPMYMDCITNENAEKITEYQLV